MNMDNQPILNIGCFGSVSDGKSTLVEKLTGIKTQKHSNEKIKNITIKLGYANMKIWEKNNEYITSNSDINHDDYKLINHISFVDCPGHQELINTMLTSINIINGAIIVIAIDQPLNKKPQLIQHLAAIKLGKIKNIIVLLNKIDLVKKDILLYRKEEVDELLNKYDIKPKYIIPVCLNKKINLNYVIESIVQVFNPDNILNHNSTPLFRISRSFDINKPGTDYNDLSGGVIGGTLLQGKLKLNDEIEIRPGIISKDKNNKINYNPIKTKILSIKTDNIELNEISPGGLVAIKTDIDPYYTKNDCLTGNILGYINELPNIYTKINLKINITKDFDYIYEPKINDNLFLQIGTKNENSILKNIKNDIYELELLKPICICNNDNIIVCKNDNKILKIIGSGYLVL
jgi:translation initiation factor 2 subunit 3